MGDEFIAKVQVRPPMSKVAERLVSTGRYLSESGDENNIQLRFSDKERRADWPEDFMLSWKADELLLLIHIGTGEKKDVLLSDIELILKNLGTNTSFTEI